MVWSIIISAIIIYIIVMFIVHELFRKFFHMLLFVGFILFALAVGYMALKGF